MKITSRFSRLVHVLLQSSLLIFTLLILTLAKFAHADDAPSDVPKNPMKVTATTGMIADVAKEIGGERIVVSQIIGSGVDPHLYKLTRSDLALLNSSDLIFFNGLLLEGKMGDALSSLAQYGKHLKAVTTSIPKEELFEGLHGAPDPHVWMDPALWTKAAHTITKTLTELDPAGAVYFKTNNERYQEKLQQLLNYAQTVSKSIPESSRVLVTAHDAFHYFGHRFSFEVYGIQGISTESEAGIRDIEKLVDTLVTRKIPAVFIESTISEKSIRSLIDGAEARSHKVSIGGQLFSDAFGKDGTYEGTYIGMIDHNVTTIVRSLGGTAPEHGMNGLLQ